MRDNDMFKMVLTHEGTILYVNDSYQRTLHIRLSSLYFTSIFEHTHPEDHVMFKNILQQVETHQEEREVYYRFSYPPQFTTFKGLIRPIKITSDSKPRIELKSELIQKDILRLEFFAQNDEELQDLIFWLSQKRNKQKR